MQENEVAREILAYLVDHPESQDTLEGIVQWWLLEQEIKWQKEIIKEVLEELVRRGLILEYKGGDSRIHYRMNKDKYEEIKSLICENPD